MDLNTLKTLGAIKDRSQVKKTITFEHFPLLPETDWADPDVPEYEKEKVTQTFDVFVRKTSSADSLEVIRAEPRYQSHILVMRCILNDQGEQLFPTLEDVVAVQEWLFLPLFRAAKEVNNLGPKLSPLKTSSGASSRSASGGKASRRGKRKFQTKSAPSGSPTSASTAL